jgi:hypothetical protein
MQQEACRYQGQGGCYYWKSKRSGGCLQSQAKDCVGDRGQTLAYMVSGSTVESERLVPFGSHVAAERGVVIFEVDLAGPYSGELRGIASR